MTQPTKRHKATHKAASTTDLILKNIFPRLSRWSGLIINKSSTAWPRGLLVSRPGLFTQDSSAHGFSTQALPLTFGFGFRLSSRERKADGNLAPFSFSP